MIRVTNITWLKLEIFWKARQTLSGENIHRHKGTPLTFAISVTIFSSWVFYEDTNTAQGTIPLCERVRIIKDYKNQRIHSRNPVFFVYEKSKGRKKETREILQTPEKCPHSLQAGVENVTCARLFKQIFDAHPTPSTSVSVCVRVNVFVAILQLFVSCRNGVNTAVFSVKCFTVCSMWRLFVERQRNLEQHESPIVSSGTIARYRRPVAPFFSSIEKLITGYAIKMQG